MSETREAVITAVRIAAAHEGVAELVVTLRHGNGGLSEVALDHIAASALLENCSASLPEQLIGHRWQKVRDALGVSWNRYQQKETIPCLT
jgi:hypothetical protein